MYYLLSSPFTLLFAVAIVIWISKVSGRVKKMEDRLKVMELGTLPVSSQSIKVPVEASIVTPIASGIPISSLPDSPPVLPTSMSNNDATVTGEDAGGRILGKFGIVAVFAGVAFFLKYAFDSGLIGPMARIMMGFLGGLSLFALGNFLRKNHEKYAEMLMGGSVAILYLTAFSAFSFYHFISAPSAYGIMLLITALSAVVSIVNKSPVVAIMGIIGGFITPMFMQSYITNPSQLLLYTLILDLGVVAIAYVYRWINLSYIAFVGTILTILPYTLRDTSYDNLTFGYATVFFILFLVGSMLHHVVRKEKSAGADIALITLNGILYALLSYNLLYSSLQEVFSIFLIGLAMVYFVAGYLALVTNREDEALNFALPSLTVLFLSLAVPIMFSGPWITVAWFIEAAILFALSRVMEGHKVHVFGLAVYSVGVFRALTYDNLFKLSPESSFNSVLNERFILLAFIVAITYIITYLVWKNRDMIDAKSVATLIAVFVVASQAITVFAITSEIHLSYGKVIRDESAASYKEQQDCVAKYGYSYDCRSGSYSNSSLANTGNTRNTVISIVWALYGILLLLTGFKLRSKLLRILGFTLLIITVFKVFIDVWSLGPLYRIVSSIAVGVVALAASFLYSKFKDRLHEVL